MPFNLGYIANDWREQSHRQRHCGIGVWKSSEPGNRRLDGRVAGIALWAGAIGTLLESESTRRRDGNERLTRDKAGWAQRR